MAGGRNGDATADRGDSREKAGLLPHLELPRGGGAIRGIDEKFAVSPATGTGSTRVPIASSPGRGGFELSLSLAYDSGAGNGPFGLGWQLSAPAITRKTDKGLPRYADGEDSDVFVLSGAEDLVPLRVPDGEGTRPLVSDRGEYHVQCYRPRVEAEFARIERWTHRVTCDVHWRSITSDNVLHVYGATPVARIADPERPDRVFSWLLEETRDDRGNVASYVYKAEDGAGVDPGKASEASRVEGSSRGACRFLATAQRYLKRIRYGNRAPIGRDEPAPERDDAWLFELVFDYGEHAAAAPSPREEQPWPVRRDAFSSYRSTFEVRTYRLCRRVLMFHRFEELGPAPVLVRSTDLSYDEGPVVSYLTSVVHAGYLRQPGASGHSRAAMPPTDFGYIRPVLHDEPRTLDRQSLLGIQDGVDGTRAQWVDLDGEGIAGVLIPAERAWYYKANRGDGRLDPPLLLSSLPSPAELTSGVQQLTDLGGDGRLDLVQYAPPLSGYFERTEDGGFAPFVSLPSVPNIDWSDPNLRFLDIDGDGLPDAFITENDALVWYRSRGKGGFEPGRVVPRAKSEQRGPAVLFDNGTETIQLADMSGDGLVDIVRVRSSEVSYWPNLGHGRFGPKVTLDGNPRFDAPELFDPKRVRLADIDGSGPADIAYLGRDGVRLYFNESGNGLSEATRLRALPPADALTQVSFVDLLGQGTACLVYSTPLPGPSARRVVFVDLMGGRKPHLLESVVNNLGAESRIAYAASTRFYLEDKAAGSPWLTRLPFPVQVVERVEHVDRVAKTRLVTTYSYHHGFFDGVEREFRGFARVEQRDAESFSGERGRGLFPELPGDAGGGGGELRLPPVRTVTWFHTGAWLEKERLERELASEYYPGDAHGPLLPDTTLPPGLSTREEREAARALRGRLLRQEVYAEDGTPEAPHPYTVSERDYEVRVLQRADEKSHAAFFVHSRDTLNLHYERKPQDPRTQHEMVLEVDELGNTTRSVAIAYPRRAPLEPEQSRLWATVSEHRFAHLPSEPDDYRVSVLVESRTSELTGLGAPERGIFSRTELRSKLGKTCEIAYEADAGGTGVERRAVDHERHFYYRDYTDLAASREDAAGPLPLGQITVRALAHHTLRLAFTPGLLAEVYGERVSDELLREAGYVFEDGAWWARSGRAVFDPARFFLPSEALDPFGRWSALSYDAHALLATTAKEPRVAGEAFSGQVDTEDARFGGVTRVESDYRVLAPAFLVDPNGNRTAVEFDALGMVVKTAVLGKEGAGEGDTLADPTTRLEYDLGRWQRERRPAFVRTLVREQHGAANPRFQEAFSYSDGSGNEVMRKIQAEPGLVPVVEGDGKLRRNADGSPQLRQVAERWTGTGRTVFDNKGNPIKKYEPFFSATHEYEDEAELVEHGVTPIFRYDPLGRRVRTDEPDGTFSRVVFDAWLQESWDANDNVRESRWLAERQGLPESEPERRSARLALEHAGTPSLAHLDGLSRVFLTLSDNGPGGKYPTRIELDVEGNQRRIIDARGNRTVEQRFDLLGRKLRITTADAGDVRTLPDVHDKTLRAFDARGLVVRHRYDALERPTHVFVQKLGEEEVLSERMLYGEQHPAAAELNLRAKLVHGFDSGGVISNVSFDFKGNLLASERRLSVEHRAAPDWKALAGLDSAPGAEAAASTQLESERFRIEATFDALSRMSTRTTPDRSQARLSYNEANLLERVDVRLRGAEAWTVFVANIDYNARGQRERIEYGNGTATVSSYEETTFRLSRLRSHRTRDGRVLQDLRHTYDPVGNVVEIRDGADPIALVTREAASGDGRYRYDALYRLIEAEGREHPAQQPSADDSERSSLPHRNDLSALRRYTERYAYDSTGNLLELAHRGRAGGWTRRYTYAEDNNRLLRTSGPLDREGDAGSESYDYDQNGNMTRMPHLGELRWDFDDRLEYVDLRGGGAVHYRYDAEAKRVRKVREHNGVVEERIYLGGYEVYRRRRGGVLELERETLHVMDNHRRVALVETKTRDTDEPQLTPAPRQRYQLDNHLRSSVVELDESGGVISYEEYYPFGATSFHAFRSGGEVSAKRYRYIGQERDEETGLYHNGARYYAAWLGRWTSPDPAGLIDGTNVYSYSRNNPMTLSDPTGLWGWREVAVVAAVVVVGTVVTVATAGAAAPLAAAAVASVGLSGTAAAVATGAVVGAVAGAVGGAAAGAAGETTREVVHGEQLSLGKIAGAAGEGAKSGALIGGAIGGAVPLVAAAAGAAASTTAGAAVIGAASRVGQGVARSAVGQAAAAGGRAVASAASAAAKAPGVRQALGAARSAAQATSRGLQAIEGAGRSVGEKAARALLPRATTASASTESAAVSATEALETSGAAAATEGGAAAEATAAGAATRAPATTAVVPRTNAQLIQDIATRAESQIGGIGGRAGSLKHGYANRLLQRYQRLYGDRGLRGEISFMNRRVVPYGTKGSARIDVLDVNANIAYDYKFVVRPPGLSPRQVAKIQTHGPRGVTVREVNP